MPALIPFLPDGYWSEAGRRENIWLVWDFFTFVVKQQSQSGGQEAGLWDHLSSFLLYHLLCTLLLGKIHFFKIRAALQAFLPTSASDSNTAQILVACVKQSAPSFLLVW